MFIASNDSIIQILFHFKSNTKVFKIVVRFQNPDPLKDAILTPHYIWSISAIFFLFTKYLSNGYKSGSKIIQMWNFMNAHNELGMRPKNVLFSMLESGPIFIGTLWE